MLPMTVSIDKLKLTILTQEAVYFLFCITSLKLHTERINGILDINTIMVIG